MAKLSSNGKALAELIACKRTTDNADADAMTRTTKATYRVMESGFVLKKVDSWLDFGFGKGEEYFPGTWKRFGKVKPALLQNSTALFNAMQKWCDELIEKGWDAEIS